MPRLTIFLIAAAFAAIPGVTRAQGCVGTIGSIPMNGTFSGTIERGRACWSPEYEFWWQAMTFEVQRDTAVWIFYSASDDARIVVADMEYRPIRVSTVFPGEGERRYGASVGTLRRGQYRLQIQAARPGTRFTARPHYGSLNPQSATGLCHRSSAPVLTSNPTFTFPLAEVAPGVALACIDPEGRAALIRRFDLAAPTDVAFELRARDRSAKSAIYLSGPGHSNTNVLTAVSPKPGDPARLTVALGRGTHYVVFGADAKQTTVDASVRKTPSTTTAALPTTRSPACSDLSRLPALAPGRTVAGRLTPDGSCGIAAAAGWPGGYAEVYRLSIPQRGRVAIEVESRSFAPAVAIFGMQAAAPLATQANAGADLSVRMPVTLEPGDYLLAVGHARPTEIGSYNLTVDPD